MCGDVPVATDHSFRRRPLLLEFLVLCQEPFVRKLLLLLCSAFISLCHAQSSPVLLRQPTVSKSEIVFTYAGDLWSVGRDGGEARRMTSALGTNMDAKFSPDGSMIAFTGRYAGNRDVYVMPAGGGQPRRLTYHPAADEVMGWTPGGKSVLFRRSEPNRHRPGIPELLPVPACASFNL